ncbi:hypothetical protein TNCV_1595001 [Trichonephila clavipes]|nr:hypothetical protein TNCV_1595001 [Trichonephila clavipes]
MVYYPWVLSGVRLVFSGTNSICPTKVGVVSDYGSDSFFHPNIYSTAESMVVGEQWRVSMRSGREKKKEKWDDKKRVENREGSLGYPGFVTPVFTKENNEGMTL